MDIHCAVDIGTNSVKFALARLENGNIHMLKDFGIVTGIGRGTAHNGLISEESILRTIHKISEVFSSNPDIESSSKTIVATEAMRCANNSKEVSKRLSELFRTEIRVISVGEEIGYCVKAIQYYHKLKSGLIVDLGGGTLNIADWDGIQYNVVSSKCGILFMHDKFIINDPPSKKETTAIYEYTLAQLKSQSMKEQFVVTVGATAKIIAGISSRRPRSNNFIVVESKELATLGEYLSSTSYETVAKTHSIDLERSKLLPAGVTIYRALADKINASEFHVSGYGVRHGVLVKKVER